MNAIVVIPTLNEEKNISRVLTEILHDSDCIHKLYVVDGGSSDRTVNLVEEVAKNSIIPIVIVHNKNKIQACAVNMVADMFINTCDDFILVRVDAHAFYPECFVSKLINTCLAKQVDSVVVPMITIGGTKFQNSASALFNSWLGTGGASHRSSKKSGFVDHGHHAAFRLRTFLDLGGYNSKFIANEDAEFDVRLIAKGGLIFLDSEAAIKYIPRSNFKSLAKQYFKYGYYRCSTIYLHKTKIKLRQLLPLLSSISVLMFFCSMLLFFISKNYIFIYFSVPAFCYMFSIMFSAFFISADNRSASWSGVAFIAIVTHLAFGFGFLRRIFGICLGEKI